jgi:predicted nucleic acid-binding protein
MANMLQSKGKQIIELASGPAEAMKKNSEEVKGQTAELSAVRNKLEELTAEKLALHASLEAERGKAKQAEGQEQAMKALAEQERCKVTKLEQEIKSLKQSSQSSENARLAS